MSVPKLRFKKFDGEWAETSFQDLFIFKNGVNASKEQYGSGIKFINVLDIINNPNGITYDSIIGSVDITSKEIDKNLVKYGDVLFQRSSETREEVGQSNVYLGKEPVVFGGFVIRGSAQKEYDAIFMNGLLKTDSLRDQITQLSGGSTRFNIGQDSLNKVTAYLPSKLEQTKIASFLSEVDEKISQLTKKHALLSQYKQGMMQKLFSQQIRFKADDGSEFGEWEEIKLGDIASKVGSGSTPRGGAEAYTEDGIIFIRSQNVNNNQLLLDDVVYIPEQTHKKMSGSKVVANDILLNITGASIGRSCVVPMNFTEANVNQHVCIIRTPNDNPRFIQSFLASKDGQNLIDSHQTGSGREGLNFQSIRSFTLNRPCLEEQTQIANFLSAIDQKIEKVAQQIEETKQWKKGLLQQMFV
ncbi:restriction endonuclease subunit S [Acinetobacter oleivorans]|uniref:restriction endonuclease subunit S n=1 Tax=Acinetobacter oleivorans TaxID=1148157 RepID=UPI003A8BE94B